jgi:hypothetical protein
VALVPAPRETAAPHDGRRPRGADLRNRGRTEVTVTGRNFGDVTGVAFAGVDAASFAITSPHQLTAVVPPAATTGPITLSGPTPLTTYQLFTITPPGHATSG